MSPLRMAVKMAPMKKPGAAPEPLVLAYWSFQIPPWAHRLACLSRYTIGQTAVGIGSSAGIIVKNGFWQSLDGMCCSGRVGDANGQGEYPDEVTLSDIMLMIDAKFISGDCSKLPCVAEADVNQNGGADPNCDDHVTLGDIMALVDFLFITGPDVAVLPECL